MDLKLFENLCNNLDSFKCDFIEFFVTFFYLNYTMT